MYGSILITFLVSVLFPVVTTFETAGTQKKWLWPNSTHIMCAWHALLLCHILPMHGVVKEASSTTKLRVVFDGSAHSSPGISLNDLLLPGPCLYPHISTIINRFRMHPVAMVGDVSKMFREVALAEQDRDLHRFVHEGKDSGKLEDFRMSRLTFGISSSPFLASQMLKQMAEDYHLKFPVAAQVIKDCFYVDDVLTGAQSIEEAVQLRQELNQLLEQG